jgi:hypothetical protein
MRLLIYIDESGIDHHKSYEYGRKKAQDIIAKSPVSGLR